MRSVKRIPSTITLGFQLRGRVREKARKCLNAFTILFFFFSRMVQMYVNAIFHQGLGKTSSKLLKIHAY